MSGFAASWFRIATLAAIVGLAACGNGGASSGVELRRGNVGEPDSLDPHYVTGTVEDAVIGDMLMGLTTEDADANPIPGAAESWETSEDGLTWTFHLRDHQWSDGTPVTADDFIYAWRRILDPKTAAPYASILYVFKNAAAINAGKMPPDQLGARAIDDKTIELTLENPAPYLPQLMMHMTTFPVPKHVVEAKGKDWIKSGNYVSNGPYVLSEWIPNDHVTLVKNQKFYDAGNVKIDRVTFYPTIDLDAALKRFRTGDLDTQGSIPATQYTWIKQNMPGMLRQEPYLSIGYMLINTTKKPFDDKRIRQALNLAYDRETIARQILALGQDPAYSVVPPGVANYPGNVALSFRSEPYGDRVKQAQELMQAAGYGPNNRLHLEIATSSTSDARRVAAAVQQEWQAIYIDAEIAQNEGRAHVIKLQTGDYDAGAYGWVADYNDARNFLFLFMSDNTLNYARYKNDRFDALMRQSDHELDLAKRGQLMAEAEAIVLDDAPVIPTRLQLTLNLVQPYVKGWKTNVSDKNRTRWLSIER